MLGVLPLTVLAVVVAVAVADSIDHVSLERIIQHGYHGASNEQVDDDGFIMVISGGKIN